MDWKAIAGTVMGAIVLAWLGYVTSSVGEAKHERDEMRKDIQYVKIDVGENKEGIKHIWEYNDAKDKQEKAELKEEFKFAVDMIESANATRLEVKELEIRILQGGE